MVERESWVWVKALAGPQAPVLSSRPSCSGCCTWWFFAPIRELSWFAFRFDFGEPETYILQNKIILLWEFFMYFKPLIRFVHYSLKLSIRLRKRKHKQKYTFVRKPLISNSILRTSGFFQLFGQIRHREVSLFLTYFKALRLRRRTGDGPTT